MAARLDPAAARKAQRTQIALVLVGVAALGLLYWQLLYSPLVDEEQKLDHVHRKLARENKTLRDEARAQSAMLECRPELEALNRQNELMLPADAEPVAFLKVLTNMASAAGLAQGPTKKLAEAAVSRSSDNKASAKGGEEEGEETGAAADDPDRPCWERIPGLSREDAKTAGFVRVPFEIEVRGTFHQLTKYFWMVHQHAKSGRIVTIENLSLDGPTATSDGLVLTARFTAVGFREEDRAETPGDGARKSAAMGRKGAAPESEVADDVAGAREPPASVPAIPKVGSAKANQP